MNIGRQFFRIIFCERSFTLEFSRLISGERSFTLEFLNPHVQKSSKNLLSLDISLENCL